MEIKIDQNMSKVIRNSTKIAQFIKASTGRNSLTRMAQDSIFQFPLLVSSSIDTDDVTILAKALERQYASLLVSVFSLRGSVPLDKYENLQSYLTTFHNNKDIPANIKAATNMVFESANILNNSNQPLGLGTACWDIIEEQVNTSKVNDIYKPYERTKTALKEKIQIAKEASDDRSELVKKIQGTKTYDTMKRVNLKYNEDLRDHEFTGVNKDHKYPIDAPSVIKNDKTTALEPTMINAQFVLHGEGQGQIVQNVVIGVKTMIRAIRSDLMVANMVEASKDSYGIFKFIKWTKGEYKFLRDFVFNATEIKEMATSTSKDSLRWIKALKRRKAINNVTKFFKNGVLPHTTAIITNYEVEQIAELGGVNLSEVYNALKLISKYYLLGFGIYDTETKILSMLFDEDGTNEFTSVSLSSLKTSNNKEVDLTNMKEVMKLMGRI